MQLKLEVSKEAAGYVKGIIDMINNYDAEAFEGLYSVSRQIEKAIEEDNDDMKFDDPETMCDQLMWVLAGKSSLRQDEIEAYMKEHEEFRKLWNDLMLNVGEAMGPFCYAAYKFEKFIADSPSDEVIGPMVIPQCVRDVIDFYEDRWRF